MYINTNNSTHAQTHAHSTACKHTPLLCTALYNNTHTRAHTPHPHTTTHSHRHTYTYTHAHVPKIKYVNIYYVINSLDKIRQLVPFLLYRKSKHNMLPIIWRPKQLHRVFMRKGSYSHWHTHTLTVGH